MKKLHLAFGISALALIVVGLLHGGIAWIIAEQTWDPFATSFPTWAAMVIPLLFYALGDLVVLLAWFITWIIVGRIRKKNCKEISNVL